jgi:hypothetical protein
MLGGGGGTTAFNKKYRGPYICLESELAQNNNSWEPKKKKRTRARAIKEKFNYRSRFTSLLLHSYMLIDLKTISEYQQTYHFSAHMNHDFWYTRGKK